MPVFRRSYTWLCFTLAYGIPLDIQDLQPNATIFIPSVTGAPLSPGELVIASAITVLPGDTTIIQIVDHNPTPSATDQDPITFTIAVSPTGFQSDLSLPDKGIISYEETCFALSDGGGGDSCSEVGVFNFSGTIITTQKSNIVPTFGFAVVALNFDQSSSSSSPMATTTSFTTLPSPTTPPSVAHTNTPTFGIVLNPATTTTTTITAATSGTPTSSIAKAAVPPPPTEVSSAATKSWQSGRLHVLGLAVLISHLAYYQWI
ncbi:hypothetical protein Clacol_009566 [Clathrus columnatus]|uniref:Uncharacterized protein n=1 Tax=Clathrus columnatus TaxID=1419009 RepID=A0AAV5AR87_9AGAM|nr:hypothetical protein Clacol_009566 [Clathrus columnatus]